MSTGAPACYGVDEGRPACGTSGTQVRMRWSGWMGFARGRNGLSWVIAVICAPVGALAQEVGDTPVIGSATFPRDLSPWGMYLNADPVVKAVLIGLAFASLVTWTVWLAKTIEIVFAKRRVRRALQVLASVRSTSEGMERLATTQGEVRKFLDAAMTELKLSSGSLENDGIKERIASRLERIEAA